MVGIKDFEMPSNCYMCDLHNYHYCDLTGESIEEDYCWNENSREKHCPLREVEAIPKDQYEQHLKADMVAMLTDIKKEIEEKSIIDYDEDLYDGGECVISISEINEVIQQKINSLKEA
jgi:hypothetical protein